MHATSSIPLSELRKVVRLIGSTASLPGGLEHKRTSLLTGLAGIIQADGWSLTINGETDATHSYRIQHSEISENGLSTITLYRTSQGKPFSDLQERIARLIFEETIWLHWTNDVTLENSYSTKLFPQEQRTLDLLRTGISRRKVAKIMNLSESTISSYTKSLFNKLGVHSQPELMKKYLNGNQ